MAQDPNAPKPGKDYADWSRQCNQIAQQNAKADAARRQANVERLVEVQRKAGMPSDATPRDVK